MSQQYITPLLTRTFIWSFIISIGSVFGLVAIGVLISEENEFVTLIATLLIFLIVAAGWAWYISLGIIAYRLGRSWIAWIGLSFIFSPIGPFVAFLLMLSHIDAVSDKEPGDE